MSDGHSFSIFVEYYEDIINYLREWKLYKTC